MTHELERQEIQEVIREYQQQGYEVITLEDVESFPEFLKGYQPDLLMKKADEMVVVEMRTRSMLSDQSLSHLAQAIEHHPDWRLDLVVIPQEDQDNLISVDEIRDRLTQTRQLTELGQFEAALLLIGSAIEATLRIVYNRENISASTQEISPLALLKTIFSWGLLEDTDYKSLQRGLALRDKLARGFQLSQSDSTLISSNALIHQFVDIVEHLLSG